MGLEIYFGFSGFTERKREKEIEINILGASDLDRHRLGVTGLQREIRG